VSDAPAKLFTVSGTAVDRLRERFAAEGVEDPRDFAALRPALEAAVAEAVWERREIPFKTPDGERQWMADISTAFGVSAVAILRDDLIRGDGRVIVTVIEANAAEDMRKEGRLGPDKGVRRLAFPERNVVPDLSVPPRRMGAKFADAIGDKLRALAPLLPKSRPAAPQRPAAVASVVGPPPPPPVPRLVTWIENGRFKCETSDDRQAGKLADGLAGAGAVDVRVWAPVERVAAKKGAA
jgi:hypothetical protein